MLCLYYVRVIGDAQRLIADRHPTACDMPTMPDDDRPATASARGFVTDMNIYMSPDIHIRQQGSGVRSLLRIFNARRQCPGQLLCIAGPEAGLHPGAQSLLAEWMMRNGDWVAETCSEMFALRLARVGHGHRVEIFVVDASGVSAVDELASAASGLPTCSRIRIGPDGELLDPWPGGFFPERLKELL